MREYAAYEGERFVGKGTIKEVAELLGIAVTTAYTRSSPSYQHRLTPTSKRVVKLHEGPNEYMAYRGEEFLTIGTVEELAEFLNIKSSTVRFMATPSYKKRRKPNGEHLLIVKMEPEEGE